MKASGGAGPRSSAFGYFPVTECLIVTYCLEASTMIGLFYRGADSNPLENAAPKGLSKVDN